MTASRGQTRKVVVHEVRLTLDEACGVMDRLTESLDPRLPDEVADYSYARSLLQQATQVIRQLDSDEDGVTTADTLPIVRVDRCDPEDSLRLGWYG